ncbi:MAG: putative toxin-antitoxin system toxin component, PIN family [Actinomycetota bacterium]
MRVVVDANVCVSAVLSQKGNPARILNHALGNGPYDFELCAPSQLFSKLEEVLARPKIVGRLGWSREEIAAYARRLRLAVEEILLGDAAHIPRYTSDPEDDPYVHAAVLARASYLVSGDEDILGMKDPPVEVLGPSRFVKLWESNLL